MSCIIVATLGSITRVFMFTFSFHYHWQYSVCRQYLPRKRNKQSLYFILFYWIYLMLTRPYSTFGLHRWILRCLLLHKLIISPSQNNSPHNWSVVLFILSIVLHEMATSFMDTLLLSCVFPSSCNFRILISRNYLSVLFYSHSISCSSFTVSFFR